MPGQGRGLSGGFLPGRTDFPGRQGALGSRGRASPLLLLLRLVPKSGLCPNVFPSCVFLSGLCPGFLFPSLPAVVSPPSSSLKVSSGFAAEHMVKLRPPGLALSHCLSFFYYLGLPLLPIPIPITSHLIALQDQSGASVLVREPSPRQRGDDLVFHGSLQTPPIASSSSLAVTSLCLVSHLPTGL